VSGTDSVSRPWGRAQPGQPEDPPELLPYSEPRERLGFHFYVLKDLSQKTSTDLLALVGGDDGRATIAMLPEGVAPPVPDQAETQTYQDGVKLPGGDGS
jgi:hypothetical protein